jgi:hypothetical protein
VPKVVTVGKTTTGEDGAFAFGPLDPGDYDLFAEHAQFFLDAESGARRLSLSDGQAEPIDLLLSPAGSIRGRLRSRRPLGVDGFHEVLATRVPEEGEKAAAPRPELILRGEDEIIFEDDGPGKLAPAEMDDAPGEGDGGIRARVQANGEYLIEGLRPGTYRLAIARYEEPLAPGDLAKSRGPVRKGEPADAGLVEVAAGEVKTADLDAP